MKELPYGTWPSPISADMLAKAAVGLSEPWLAGDALWWRETRPTEGGRSVVVRAGALSEPADVTPAGFDVRTKVHEYGGGSLLVADSMVFFSNFTDQRLYRQELEGEPVAITEDTGGRHRYADGRLTPDGGHLVYVRERHEDDGVVNELVAFPPDGSAAPRVIVSGRDFYAAPRLSTDGTRLAWLSWDLPWMPWDGCELWVAQLAPDASLSRARKVAGTDAEESILQPGWSPGGELHFLSDRSGWWNLYREGDADSLCAMPAEFGWPHWVFGRSSYAFLDDGRIACLYDQAGRQHVGVLDPQTGELIDLDLPYTAIDSPYIIADGPKLAFIAGGPSTPNQLVTLDFASRSVDVVRESEAVAVDPGFLCEPRSIEFPTEGGLIAHAIYYPPANRDAVAPVGERAPLIVMSHGGPTSSRTPAFDLSKQFWTSRGFAVVDVNYGGSTGYGRAYRMRLNGTWGVTDTSDCINAAQYLVAEGLADADRLLIRGGSAGGYTTLCALTQHEEFAAGASYYGISDLEPFAEPGGTHKFESRYEHTLIGPYPEAAELYRERSPIHFVDRISAPMLILQGAEDEVVPPAQAEIMVDALEAKHLPYAYLLFDGEQHGFRKAETIVASFEAELSFYAQILGFEPGNPVPRLAIKYLPPRSGPP